MLHGRALRRKGVHERPQVVVTFDPRGAYGHPDHIAVSQFALTAVVMAADAAAAHVRGEPFVVSKFYYRVWSREEQEHYAEVFGESALEIDGVVRRNAPWEDWSITTRVDASAHWRTVWEAVRQHASQVGGIDGQFTDELKEKIFGCEGFYRAFSTINGGSAREDDLFAGLRG